nr:MAG TPA: PC4 and SFRS1-interacting protein binding, transciptional co-activator, domain.05A [Siphoviridae sp. ctV7v5]
MGGRGSGSSGGGAGAGGGASTGGGSIKSLEAQKKALGDKMASLVRQTDKDGQMTSEARKEYYATKSKRDDVVQKLSKAYKADAEARSKQTKSEPAEKKTFINGFGEATDRYVTSTTYERIQARQSREIFRRLNNKYKNIRNR